MRNHQKKAKYCLQLQNKKPEILYTCIDCSKEYVHKHMYDNHILKCKVKELKEKEILDLRNENKANKFQQSHIQDLLVVVKDLISRKSSNITNNINNGAVNNLIPLDPKFMKEQSKFLTSSHVNDGPDGYARFSNEYLLKDRVICTDASRGTLMFKGLDNKPKIDKKGTAILTAIGLAIVDVNKQIYDDERSKLDTELRLHQRKADDLDLSDDKTQRLYDKVLKYSEFNQEIKTMSKGKDTKFSRTLFDKICSYLKSAEAIEELIELSKSLKSDQ